MCVAVREPALLAGPQGPTEHHSLPCPKPRLHPWCSWEKLDSSTEGDHHLNALQWRWVFQGHVLVVTFLNVPDPRSYNLANRPSPPLPACRSWLFCYATGSRETFLRINEWWGGVRWYWLSLRYGLGAWVKLPMPCLWVRNTDMPFPRQTAHSLNSLKFMTTWVGGRALASLWGLWTIFPAVPVMVIPQLNNSWWY